MGIGWRPVYSLVLSSTETKTKLKVFTSPVNVDQILPSGIASRPVKDDIGVYLETSNTSSVCNAGYVGEQHMMAGVQVGETKVYSRDSNGTFKYVVWLRANGEVLIGHSNTPGEYNNWLVKYTELETAFNELNNKFNAMVTAFNAHTHIVTGAVPAVPGPPPVPVLATAIVSPVSASTANITPAKAEKIKTL